MDVDTKPLVDQVNEAFVKSESLLKVCNVINYYLLM